MAQILPARAKRAGIRQILFGSIAKILVPLDEPAAFGEDSMNPRFSSHDNLDSKRLREQFEAGWNQDSMSQIEVLVAQVNVDERAELLVELISIDLANRLQRGLDVSREGYQAIIPNSSAATNEAFRRVDSQRADESGDGSNAIADTTFATAQGDRNDTDLEILHRFVQEFEEDLRAGREPDPTAHLQDPRIDGDVLLRQLLEVEIRIRRSQSKQPDTESLKKRYPLAAAVIESLLREVPDRRRSPDRIGPYKIRECIGEGGMGTVYMADQERPVRRRVALKVIKSEVSDRQIIARFEAERQALAMMEHKNIAKVLDSGTTEHGNPFFVMELIQGLPLNQHCDRSRLTIEDRLRLFVDVCKAVQHAHQKGIIHRDLKPSNVLVRQSDSEAEPKVIDFGLAKALQHQTRLTDKTLHTEVRQVLGTLQYMSPEQAALDNINVDTRSDVYSLGVMLYELLAGSTPIERKTVQEQSVFRVLEYLRDATPPRPSVRLTADQERLNEISEKRRISPARLQQIMRGELDWIVMKSLERDRSQRYETAAAFADDIERYLCGEAIVARPASVSYRLRKSIGRNRGAFAAGAGIFLLLIVAILGTGTMWFRAANAEDKATRAAILAERERETAIENAEAAKQAEQRQLIARKEAEQQRDLAEIEAEKASVLSSFLIRTFDAADPILQGSAPGFLPKSKGGNLTASEILEQSVQKIPQDSQLRKFPLVRASLLNAIGSVYRQLGLFDEAEPLLREALEIREDQLQPDHPELAESLHNYGWYFHERGNFPKALELYDRAAEIRQQLSDTDSQIKFANTLHNKAWLLGQEGWLDESRELFEECLNLRVQMLGPNHRDTLFTRLGLCFTMIEQGEHAQAFQQILIIRPLLGSIAIDEQLKEAVFKFACAVLCENGNLGVLGLTLGDPEKNFRDALQSCSAVLGADNIYVGLIHAELGLLLENDNRLSEAREEYEKAIEISRERVQFEHPRIMLLVDRYAGLMDELGTPEKAVPIWQEFMVGLERRFDNRYGPLQLARYRHGMFLKEIGNKEQALEVFRNIINTVNEAIESESGYRYRPTILGDAHNQAGICLEQLGRLDEGLAQYSQAEAAYKKAANDPQCLDAAWPILNSVWNRVRKEDVKEASRILSTAGWIGEINEDSEVSRYWHETSMRIATLSGDFEKALGHGESFRRTRSLTGGDMLELAEEYCLILARLEDQLDQLYIRARKSALNAVSKARDQGIKRSRIEGYKHVSQLKEDADFKAIFSQDPAQKGDEKPTED